MRGAWRSAAVVSEVPAAAEFDSSVPPLGLKCLGLCSRLRNQSLQIFGEAVREEGGWLWKKVSLTEWPSLTYL